MSTACSPLDQDIWRPQYNPWLIAVVVALAAFMEVLDTSIANVALPYMAGNLGASNDQSTWVLTSYLVSNAIILPISGWLRGRSGPEAIFHEPVWESLLQFFALRDGAESWVSSSVRFCKARAAAACSRWLRPFWQTPFRRNNVACVRAVWHYRHYGAHDWANSGRMDHFQLFLALDLFHQSPGRRGHLVSGAALCRRSSLFKPAQGGGGQIGLRWHCFLTLASARCRFCSTRARKMIGSDRASSRHWSSSQPSA